MFAPANEYEESLNQLQKLCKEFNQKHDNLNEATTRLRYIDRLFFDCLGWDRTDCDAERHHNGEYTDYEFMAPRLQLIVEAKREGNYLELPAGISSLEHSIPTLIKDNPKIGDAIRQVFRYCSERGAAFAAVTNGHQIITFVAMGYGTAPLEGRALVFSSLEYMVDNFKELWNVLSKNGVEDKYLQKRLAGISSPPLTTQIIRNTVEISRHQE